MKNSIIINVLCFSFVAFTSYQTPAQMVDIMSNIAIQGQISAQGAKQAKTAMGMFKQNEIINKMNLMIAEIQTRPRRNYSNVSKVDTSFNLSPLEWNIGPHDKSQFFIELKNIDSSSCNRFKNSFTNAVDIWVNYKLYGQCSTNNTIKFIFD